MDCIESGSDVEAVGESFEGSYFVSTYPPFSCWREDDVAAYRSVLARPPAAPCELGIYVHVPFCADRCDYCYYLSQAHPEAARVERYLDCVLRELAWLARKPALAGRVPGFVYFGGGTPSMLSPPQIGRLMDGVAAAFARRSDTEVTFECAPMTASPDRLRALRDHGVTRLSIGVQQLDDSVLKKNGRVHSVADVERAWESARATGFDYVNVDLIAGLVGETDASFFDSLERVRAMGPESVTIYQLEIPLNTPLYRAIRAGRLDESPPSRTTARRRLAAAFRRLEGGGYERRSAYAAVRDPESHRFLYQDAQYHGADLLGVGASSFSYVDGAHQQNIASIAGYLACVERGDLPLGRAHASSEDEQIVRFLALQLKLGRADAAWFRARFGIDLSERFAEPFDRLEKDGVLTIDERGVSVTRRGLLRIDEVIPQLYLERHRHIRYS